MRPALYAGALKIFGSPWHTPTATFPEIFNELFFRSILWMCVQNLKFVTLPVPEIIGCTPKRTIPVGPHPRSHRSAFLPAPIRITLNDFECLIQLKVRVTDGMLEYLCCGFPSWLCVTEWLSATKMRPMNCDFRAYEVCTNFRRGLLQRRLTRQTGVEPVNSHYAASSLTYLELCGRLSYTGWAKKTGPFLNVDNFAKLSTFKNDPVFWPTLYIYCYESS